MANYFLTLFLTLFLTGCATVGERSIVWHKGDVLALCKTDNPRVQGCFWRGSGVCHVAAPDWDFETLGHEVKHCFDGTWHP